MAITVSGSHRFREIGHEPGHPIAFLYPAVNQGLLHSGNLFIQLIVGQRTKGLSFALEYDCGTIIPESQQVFGEIQSGAGKPAGAGHFVDIVYHFFRFSGMDDFSEIPDRFPEIGCIFQRPFIQISIGLKV